MKVVPSQRDEIRKIERMISAVADWLFYHESGHKEWTNKVRELHALEQKLEVVRQSKKHKTISLGPDNYRFAGVNINQ